MNQQIIIASDHAGYTLKQELIKHINTTVNIIDLGTHSSDSVDYPDIMHKVANQMKLHPNYLAIIICGSGNGVAMTVNKYDFIRCALCWNPEIAELAKAHNNANVISLPSRFITTETAFDIVSKFLSTEFEGGRHLTRVNKISNKQTT